MSFKLTNAFAFTLLIVIAVALWVIMTHWLGYLMWGALCIIGYHYWMKHRLSILQRQQETSKVIRLDTHPSSGVE